jgi:membrane-associated phospholipid phosphatase
VRNNNLQGRRTTGVLRAVALHACVLAQREHHDVTGHRSLIETTGEAASRSLRTAGVLAVSLVIAGIAALAIDLPVAEGHLADKLGLASPFRMPGDLRKAIHLCEVFGHGIGAGLILLAVYFLDPVGRPRIPRMVACVLGAGLTADAIKMLVARARPHALVDQHIDFSQTTVFETFGPLLPLWTEGHAGQSFPSAHAATAAGLAVALAWRYPHGRWVFAAFALLAGYQRVVAGAHFVSDVCWGLAAGLAVATLIAHSRAANSLFARIEQRGKRASAPNLAQPVGPSPNASSP